MDDASWVKIYESAGLVATIVVVLGVAGEFLSSYLARRPRENIEKASQAEIARLNTAAETSKLESLATTERLKATEKKIADAKLEAANAHKIAEEERLARIELETKIAPRQYTDKQEEQIQLHIGLSGLGKSMKVVSYRSDLEGWKLGRRLIRTFRSCNIKVIANLGTKEAQADYETAFSLVALLIRTI